jgi:hypothetical protein
MAARSAKVADVPVRQYLNTAEVAEMLRVSRRTVEKWRLKGVGPRYSRSATGAILYWVDDVLRHADHERVTTLDQAA